MDRRYSESHEWVEVEGDVATIGVTDHAQDQLGDIVYVELPEVGSDLVAASEAAVLESTKAAADVYSPVSGTVTAVNEALSESPDKVNASAESEGWLFKLRLSKTEELTALLDESKYRAMIG